MMTHAMISTAQTITSPPDTVVLALPPTFLSTAEAVATVILTLAVVGVLLAVMGVLRELRSFTRTVKAAAARVEKDSGPVIERARSVAENVDFITFAIRNDVQKLNDSVARLNDRLKQASDRMEERIQDFTALVEVLQAEAEELALDTAAAVRGVRTGTQSLTGSDGVIAGERRRDSISATSSDPEG
jgi:uncharacterized protein YoxC